MTASTLCMIAERRGAPYADAQYWGRYGRCIVKGYPKIYHCHLYFLASMFFIAMTNFQFTLNCKTLNNLKVTELRNKLS